MAQLSGSKVQKEKAKKEEWKMTGSRNSYEDSGRLGHMLQPGLWILSTAGTTTDVKTTRKILIKKYLENHTKKKNLPGHAPT